jgi:hypothetical protein
MPLIYIQLPYQHQAFDLRQTSSYWLTGWDLIPAYRGVQLFSRWQNFLQCSVVVVTLKNDIKNSVVRSPDGYMNDLRKNTDLQRKNTAINHIFDPEITDQSI